MPKELRIADEFAYALAGIYPERVLDHIRNLLSLLPDNPEIGSTNVRRSLVDRYGSGIRKLAVSSFVIVYRVSDYYVDVLALVYGPSIV
ncbi:MAG: type II toxin-antitoxin system RelE/ParE family toxin [Eggerthellaceae bacterium]|nr:type II toxin-antitoxin system RelE/ParE family toxin [Eggerthellaceae bacterium]